MMSVDYMAVAEKAMTQIKKGAFLTVQVKEQLNTMTIGWATLGYVWAKPIVMVAVRNTRHTFGIIEKAADFTISVPGNDMKEKLAFCGTKSGRHYDKFKECGLKTARSQKTYSPIIQTTGIHFECKIVYKSAMNPEFLNPALSHLYPEKDFHTLYFGELLECYEN
jgi:flavin reductase (DIM6/NTAB) family NADH-FMN oxidoreductase RutF